MRVKADRGRVKMSFCNPKLEARRKLAEGQDAWQKLGEKGSWSVLLGAQKMKKINVPVAHIYGILRAAEGDIPKNVGAAQKTFLRSWVAM